MRSPVSSGLIVIIASLLSTGSTAAERIVVTHDRMRVMLMDDDWCGETVRLDVRARDPAVFTGDRIELQRVIGGARGILSFECAAFRQIEIAGHVGQESVFAARALAANNWLLEVDDPAADRTVEQMPAEELHILELKPGMNRDDVRDRLAGLFREQELDEYGGYLFAERGCEYAEYPSLAGETGALCVIGLFEGGVLTRVILREVHSDMSMENLRNELEHLYGEPSDTHLGGMDRRTLYLAWGPFAEIDRTRLHRDNIGMRVAPLEARLHQDADALVLTLRLDELDRTGQQVSGSGAN